MVNPGLLLFIRFDNEFWGLPEPAELRITEREEGNLFLFEPCPEGRPGPRLGALWPVPTGGWILESITTYLWSLDAEKDKVVPTLTFKATFLGTFSSTGLEFEAACWGRTRMATWSPVGGGGPAALFCEGEALQSGSSWEVLGGRPGPAAIWGLMAKNTGLPFSRGNCCDLT